MPMIVRMQLPSAAPTRSVGEKPQPRPWLSLGASVIIWPPDGACVTVQLNWPWYSAVILTMTKFLNLNREDGSRMLSALQLYWNLLQSQRLPSPRGRVRPSALSRRERGNHPRDVGSASG